MSTYGERAVGLTFNPSGDVDVAKVKKMYADIIDLCDHARGLTTDGEAKRLFSIAITSAVKAITWK